MNLPSIKTLAIVFGDNAREARAVLEANRETLAVRPECAARIAECYHAPSTRDLRLTALNALAETHGIEGAQATTGEWLTYLNAGDTYTATITVWRNRYRVESWGDRVETLERQSIRFA